MENIKDTSAQKANEGIINQFEVPFDLIDGETIVTGSSKEALKKLLRPAKLSITKFGNHEDNCTNK